MAKHSGFNNRDRRRTRRAVRANKHAWLNDAPVNV